MKLFCDTVQFCNRDGNDMTPIIGICLYDEEQFPYSSDFYDVGKYKPFSLLTQPLGLIWSEKYRCYVVPDEKCSKYKFGDFMSQIYAIVSGINNGNVVIDPALLEREENQSYYTSLYTAKYLQGFLGSINSRDTIILDPCAGTGNLVDGINIDKDRIWLVEPNNKCCKILREKGYIHVVQATFEYAVKSRMFPIPTHIIMNPPFSGQRDIVFFNMAYNLLNEGGTIASIISENSIYEEISKFGLDYGLTIDEIASLFLNDDRISEKMRTFFGNVVRMDSGPIEGCLTGYADFGFYGANARAYYVGGKVKKRINK